MLESGTRFHTTQARLPTRIHICKEAQVVMLHRTESFH